MCSVHPNHESFVTTDTGQIPDMRAGVQLAVPGADAYENEAASERDGSDDRSTPNMPG